MKSSLRNLSIAALGVVFGDIGTSPLYTLNTCFTTSNVQPTLDNTLGIVSLLLWALIVVVCVKYVGVLMRVDHDGEGGILALLALASPPRLLGRLQVRWLIPVVVIGAAMLMGDGVITPAISVISAVEGLNVATPDAQPFVVPIAVALLLALFVIQRFGTERVGGFFGPFMLLWFLAIAAAGIGGIVKAPQIVRALNPLHAIEFVTHHGIYGFLIFGAVILCITGVEALYADMSHFGRIPITRAWYGIVFPSLILNYMGQGAIVLSNPKAMDNPFYALAPGWMLIPMVVLATVATIIASQALISGAFTLTEQAIALNLCPRLKIVHTSSDLKGQVYIPFVNVLLAVLCLVLVVTFKSSARLASAYGLAVAVTMLCTTIAFFVVATQCFGWKKRFLLPGISLFVLVDALFVASGLPKFLDGAWVPVVISAAIFVVSMTWLRGRRSMARALAEDQLPVDEFLAKHPPNARLAGTAVMLTGDPRGVPFVRHHHWLPEFLEDKVVVLLTLAPASRPYIPQEERIEVREIHRALISLTAHFGYMEAPRLQTVIDACHHRDIDLDDELITFFYSAPAINAREKGGMSKWARRLYGFLARLSRSLVDDLDIPTDRRIALGVEVRL